MKKLIKNYWFDAIIIVAIAMVIIMMFCSAWLHDKNMMIDNGIHLLCWIGWYFIYIHSQKVGRENKTLKVVCAALMVANEGKGTKQHNPDAKVPVWKKCGPGHAFKEDAIVVGLGEDKDPRLVKCAVDASKYLLVSDLLKYLPEDKDGAK